MMEKYFYKDCYDTTVGDQLKDDKVFPLIRELNFKFGLKILKPVQSQLGADHHVTGAWCLVDKYGLAYGTAGMVFNDKEQWEYCFRTPYYLKQRGQNRQDKETVRSVKISSLISTLTREKVMTHDLMRRKGELASQATDELRSSFGRTYKSHDLTVDEVQSLLARYLGESTDKKFVDLDLDKCKMALDNMNRVDDTMNLKTQEVERFFGNGYYQIGIDEFGHLIVGKFKASEFDHSRQSMNLECIEPFKRYVNGDCEELAPFLTMVKLAYEHTNHNKTKTFGVPIIDEYNKDLDAVLYNRERPTRYDCQWIFTPLGGVL